MNTPVKLGPPRRKPIVAWKVFGVFGLALFAFCAIELWPIAYFSEGVCLTGQDIQLKQVRYIQSPGREGYRVSIQLLSPEDCQRLQSASASLARYPMWSPGALIERYTQVNWKSFDDLGKQESPQFVLRALNHVPQDFEPSEVKTIDEAKQFAAYLSRQNGALISGYHDNGVYNYTVYVLDLERGILVMIKLIT